MDFKKQIFSTSNSTTQNIRLGRSYTKPHDRTKSAWQMLWRKLKRDKKKIFGSSPRMELGVYDEESYSKNFDKGSGWMEPDNLHRSFSSRYAHPSRILPPRHLLD
ncbi:uncharacterized protein LOC127093859 [Lathyrus oleraceus]|uniref:Uncharacterized protein n=1 Tax=Pisum sativum TaxID=3888 RepID=A0A9D4W121_PEA|nr:uncharacterized protein LOC127093859 [Pisum sativum]KAI5394048.1 hypothetical protein KIW84_060951 [Pisum sativum]